MTRLYELTKQYSELQALAEDEDMAMAVADTLEGIEGEFNDKANAITSLVLNLDSDKAAIDAEIDRLNKKKKVLTNKQESIKDYLRSNMERCGINKITCPLFTITLVKGREIACIDSEESLPDQYLSVKTIITPDKAAITKAIKEGEEIPGAHLELSKSSIRIK